MKHHKEKPNRIIEQNWKLYKMNLIIDRTATDIHHIMGLKYKKEYNVEIPQNKKRIPRKFHVSYNNLVEDKQNPRDALKIVYELVKEVLSPGVREILDTVIYKTDDDLFYIPELLKHGKYKNVWTEWQSNQMQTQPDDEKL